MYCFFVKPEYFYTLSPIVQHKLGSKGRRAFSTSIFEAILKGSHEKKSCSKSQEECAVAELASLYNLRFAAFFYILWDSSICSTLKSIFGFTKEKFESKLYIL